MCSDRKMQNIYHPCDAQQDRPGATSTTVWQGKLKAVQQSAAQMATCLRSLDPAERENARQYVRALGDDQPAEEQASASTKETDTGKKRRKR